jgi:hypothetical protein
MVQPALNSECKDWAVVTSLREYFGSCPVYTNASFDVRIQVLVEMFAI